MKHSRFAVSPFSLLLAGTLEACMPSYLTHRTLPPVESSLEVLTHVPYGSVRSLSDVAVRYGNLEEQYLHLCYHIQDDGGVQFHSEIKPNIHSFQSDHPPQSTCEDHTYTVGSDTSLTLIARSCFDFSDSSVHEDLLFLQQKGYTLIYSFDPGARTASFISVSYADRPLWQEGKVLGYFASQDVKMHMAEAAQIQQRAFSQYWITRQNP